MRTKLASAALLAIGSLHVAWGLGASRPRIDREPAGPMACFAVAGLLGVAAGRGRSSTPSAAAQLPPSRTCA